MKTPFYVLYDGDCGLCKRTLKRLVALDVTHRLSPLDLRDRAGLERHGLGFLDAKALGQDIHAVQGKKVWRGYEAYRTIAGQLPRLWPVWPFLWVWPVTAIGRNIYRRVADTRSF